MIRLDRLGENISIIKENGIQYKYVLVPKALLNDLIFKITYSFIETNTIFKATTPTLSPIFTRPEKARRTCHIFMYWINAQQYLRTCGSAHFAEVIPEELSYYNVEQDDRISIPLNVFNALNPKYRTLLTKLRNIFMIDSQQSEGETSAESAEHKLIKKRLTEIGRRIGFEAVSEFDVGDFRLDVACLRVMRSPTPSRLWLVVACLKLYTDLSMSMPGKEYS